MMSFYRHDAPFAFPAKPEPRRSKVLRRTGYGFILAGLIVAVGHVSLQAPSKIAATVSIAHQIAGVPR